MTNDRPLIVGLGGTFRKESSSERALRLALDSAEKAGARIEALVGTELDLPHYDPANRRGIEAARRLIDLIRRCDGLILSSPGYHGSLSGMMKNALDYVEELRGDERVYLEGRAVGCIAVAYGWQATGTTLVTLRSIVHALRGWPTPLGVAINASEQLFDAEGRCSDVRVGQTLDAMARQVVSFSRLTASARNEPEELVT